MAKRVIFFNRSLTTEPGLPLLGSKGVVPCLHLVLKFLAKWMNVLVPHADIFSLATVWPHNKGQKGVGLQG